MIAMSVKTYAQECEIDIKTRDGKPITFYMIFGQDSVYSKDGVIRIPSELKTEHDSSFFKVRFMSHLSIKVYKIPEQLKRKELLVNLCKLSPFVIPRRRVR